MSTPSFILIADDEPMVRNLLKRVVQSVAPDTTIIEAVNGNEALDALPLHAYRAVITDYHMPGATGLTVVSTARAQDAYVPIIVVSAHVSVEPAALAAGATHFLQKPFNIQVLSAILRSILNMP